MRPRIHVIRVLFVSVFVMATQSTFALLSPSSVSAQTPTEIGAFHRSGQTFVTWRERDDVTNEFYRVYRHTETITEANLQAATMVATLPDSSAMYLTERWLADWGFAPTQENFIINDLGPELEDDQGLFVLTTHQGEEGVAYYAVTSVVGGAENTAIVPGDNALTEGVSETVNAPLPIMVWQSANGLAMVFTQFMDFRNWNPTYTGYAYNYFLSLPEDYDPSTAYPLILHIEGHGTRYVDAFLENSNGTMYGWQAIQIWGDDPHQSWYYGFTRDHNYGDNWPQYVWGDLPSFPTSGAISNFTEHRLLRAINDVIRDPEYTVDESRIYAYGHSMGGSGSLALGMRYPDVFAAVFCSEPMTHYAASSLWIWDVQQKWGMPSDNLPIINDPTYASHLSGFDGVGVYIWQNHQQNMVDRRGDEMAFIHTYHGTEDDVIDWETQGDAWNTIMSRIARRGWQGAALTIDHTWYGFLDTPNFSWEAFSFRKDISHPGFADFTLNLDQEDDLSYYNIGLEWSCQWNDFAGAIVDTPGRYEIVLRLYDPGYPGYEVLPDVGEVDVTPRRLQQFAVSPGVVYSWENVQMPGNAVIQSGTIAADTNGLLTIYGFTVTKEGNRLRIVNPTSVGESPGEKPPVVRLSQNRPNPFATTTLIEYQLSIDSIVELTVHNVVGERVCTLAKGSERAGYHTRVWDATNASGVSLPSGIYSCRLQSVTGHAQTRHIVLMR